MRPVSLCAIGLAALMLSQVPAVQAQNAEPKIATLSLAGTGEISARPDMATISAGVLVQAETARAALTANSEAMAKVIAVLKETEIADKDIQTSGFSVQPQYVYIEPRDGRQEPPRIVGYQVSNVVTTRVRDIGRLGETLDLLVSTGANQINGISFDIDDDARLLDEARRLAVEDATHKAELYAQAAKLKLVRILSIQEQGGFAPVPPVPFDARMMKAEAAGAPAPVEAGEQTLRVNVAITWEIAPAS